MPELERFFESERLGEEFLAAYDEYFQRFLEAIHQDDRAGIERLVSEIDNTKIKMKRNPRTKETPLHLAVRFGPISLIRRIVNLGTDINAQNDDGETPLHRAIGRSADIVKILLDKGANVEICDWLKVNPFKRALLSGSMDTVCLLMKKICSIELCSNKQKALRDDFKKCSEIVKNCLAIFDFDWSDYPVLVHFAAKYGDEKTLRLALMNSRYTDINSLNPEEQGLLHVIADAGKPNSLKIILHHGADVDQIDKKKFTALYYALKQNHATCVRLLLHYGADVDHENDFEIRPITYALRYCTKDIVEMLITSGAHLHEAYPGQMIHSPSPLHNACGLTQPLDRLQIHSHRNEYLTNNKYSRTEYWDGCSLEIIKLLLDKRAGINAQSVGGMTPLLVACNNVRFDIVHFLLELGADLHERVLVQPILAKNMGLISFLVGKGANINAQYVAGMTPLLFACSAGRLDIIQNWTKYFRQCRAEFNENALAEAVQGNHIDVVVYLIERGANVNAQSADGMTPLLFACSAGRFDIVQVLLKFGAHLDERALIHAVDGRNNDLVSFLIGKGFDVNASFKIRSRKSRHKFMTTPFHRVFDTCEKNSNVDLIEILADNGGIVGGPYPGGYNIVIKSIYNQQPDELVCLLELEASVEVPLKKKGVSPYSGLCCSRVSNRKNPGDSMSLKQFTAFLALKEDDISLYAKKKKRKNRTELIPYPPIYNNFDSSIFKYHEKFFKECKKETVKLKNTKICDESIVSYFDFLTKELLIVVPFTKCEKLLQVLESKSYRKKFPCYAFLLEQRVERVKKIRTDMDQIEQFMHKAYVKLPWVVIREIFSFWSVGDVRNFGRALSMN